MKLNLELKARCPDPAAVRQRLRNLGARPSDILHQIDTYFNVQVGRLKLRHIKNKNQAELIFYCRPDDSDVRLSRYQRLAVPDPPAMEQLLAAALGVVVVVRKRRELWLWHNVRIHLDEVENLGNFIELEAVLSESEHDDSHDRIEKLVRAARIELGDRLAPSYADLLTG
jgi:predicted adenylyl cyclase CyaB